MSKIRITYLGHSCFIFEKDGYMLCVDPFCSIPGFPDVSVGVNEVVCSHSHYDHAYVDGCQMLLSLVENPFEIERIPVPHDDVGGAKRGMTDIIVIKCGDVKIAHFGDVGCMPEEEVLNKLKDLDVALIPVGGVYTIDPKEAKALVDKISPDVVVPMHYRIGNKGLQNLAELSDFTKLFDKVMVLDKNHFDVPSGAKGVFVLSAV